MANHKSALKRAKQNDIKRSRNKTVKSRVKHVVKEMRTAAKDLPAEELAAKLNEVKSVIDKASKSNILHKNTAARKISRLAKLVNSVSA
ncbi:MAG: 30S ribosomal protein S20 [Desulfobacterales bacterium]|nr:30S ribosomal protein S20 [Desulfobacterales bacterium]